MLTYNDVGLRAWKCMKINVSNIMFDPVSFLLVNTPTHVGKSCERFWAIQYSTTMACIHQKNCQSWFRNSVSLFPIFPAKIARTKVSAVSSTKSSKIRPFPVFFLGKLTPHVARMNSANSSPSWARASPRNRPTSSSERHQAGPPSKRHVQRTYSMNIDVVWFMPIHIYHNLSIIYFNLFYIYLMHTYMCIYIVY